METLSDKNLDILILEDDPTSMAALQALMRKTSLLLGRIDHSETLSTALGLLRQNPTDLVLLDLNLPDSSGLNTLKVLSESYPYVPIVVITGQSDESIGLESLRSGAQDYLVKGKYSVETLEKTVKYALERKSVEEQIRTQNKFLNDILAAITHPFITIDVNNYTVTMANPAAKALMSGKKEKCHLVFYGKNEPCENCPVT